MRTKKLTNSSSPLTWDAEKKRSAPYYDRYVQKPRT